MHPFRLSPHLHRVRTLHLYADVITMYFSQKPLVVFRKARRMKFAGPIRKLFGRPSNSTWATEHAARAAGIADSLLQIIDGMSNLKEYTLRTSSSPLALSGSDFPGLERFLPIAKAGLNVCGSNLRCLALSLAVENYYAALTPTMVFPNLEYLSISLPAKNANDIRGSKLLSEILVPLVNNHHSTLKFLNLALIGYGLSDISPCLLGIRHLPHLRKLAFHYRFLITHQMDTSGIQHLLRTHAPGLRELDLNFDFPYCDEPPASEWYKQELFRVRLPNLESLTLGLGCLLDLDEAVTYAGQFGGSLTRLKFLGGLFPYHRVETMVSVFSRQDNLRTLHIIMDHLSPEFFDLLATQLPSLDTLCLFFHWLNMSACHPKSCKEESEVSICTAYTHGSSYSPDTVL